ncbi:hypothetical protein DFH08DRAFT_521553 [Mycena albidolilacea]|uniref:Uncharacterized protein n=1 Tax=Mycena albidolilacea TaxID=1033008 RepID=A0AAD7E9J2_9AGAR|nr:hypothetical protein DFH08DRAFT_521553 [Mycena albidolilacea]
MLALRADFASTSFASLVFPTADSAQPSNAKADLAKTVIEWLFVVIAVILIACLFLRKMFGTRASDSSLHLPDTLNTRASSAFGLPPTVDTPAYLCTYVATYPIAHPLPVHGGHSRPSHFRYARTPLRATTGRDIDPAGRRAHEDVDSELGLGDKDVLPAYDGRDRPPKYAVAAAAARRPTMPIAGAASAVGVAGPSEADPLQGLATSLVSSSGDNAV